MNAARTTDGYSVGLQFDASSCRHHYEPNIVRFRGGDTLLSPGGTLITLRLPETDLRGAIIVPDPQEFVESLAYYASNPIYMVREHQ